MRKLIFYEGEIHMLKVYLVYRMHTLCGEEYGPDLDRIFDSEKKAIDYIENELKGHGYHRDDYGIYEAEINDYESISLSIEEMEVG